MCNFLPFLVYPSLIPVIAGKIPTQMHNPWQMETNGDTVIAATRSLPDNPFLSFIIIFEDVKRKQNETRYWSIAWGNNQTRYFYWNINSCSFSFRMGNSSFKNRYDNIIINKHLLGRYPEVDYIYDLFHKSGKIVFICFSLFSVIFMHNIWGTWCKMINTYHVFFLLWRLAASETATVDLKMDNGCCSLIKNVQRPCITWKSDGNIWF